VSPSTYNGSAIRAPNAGTAIARISRSRGILAWSLTARVIAERPRAGGGYVARASGLNLIRCG
jgi:hypothetical protein